MSAFEFDINKSQSNFDKHGIDFEHAKNLWFDSNLIEIQANSSDEQRSLIIGLIDEKHWSAVVTYRGNNIRIISVRRARKKEISLYES